LGQLDAKAEALDQKKRAQTAADDARRLQTAASDAKANRKNGG
jgi:hypothetical protein